ncbi:MAG: hypothetical protein ACI4JZ_02715 [Oscillospiraceae bacterium]
MAVGDGGFKTAFQGFDKNEVNEYISNLRKKMNELEAEMKDNDSKVKAAVRIADEAEGKIQKLEKANSEKVAELELQIKTERRNNEDLLNQIDDLKRKVKNGGGSVSSGASSAEAQKQAAEIIEKANRTAQETVEAANKTAREVVEKAKQTAKDIVASAQSASAAGGAVAAVNLDGFLSEVKGFLEQINSGYKKICDKAEEISSENVSAPAPAPVEIPDFSDIAAPAAEAPMAEVPTTEVFDFKEPEFKEPEPELSFEDISGLNSDADDMSDDDDDMMAGFGTLDEPVTEVKENDTTEHSKASFDMDFDKELIAQTVPSSSLNANEIDEDLLAAVREEEAKHAVQPTPEEGRRDFDMDMSEDDGADAMRKMLEAAEAAFGGGSGGNLDFDTDVSMDNEPEPEPEKADNPWEDLQKQLEAMEQSGNFGESEPEPAPEPAAKESEPEFTETDDRPTPTTDDSSIWDFSSSDSSSDDDDMSGDIFANF